MGLQCGIVGLPNVGKSTIFSALTAAPAEMANYPFCTIEPNIGIVNIADQRLNKITSLIKPQKIIPAVVEFVDIAGLVKGASKGEGLGNQFLGHIRQVNAILHVVRCFDDDDIVHVNGEVDPLNDVETINLELIFADLETIEKRLQNIGKQLKSQDKNIFKKAKTALPVLERLKSLLENGSPGRLLGLTDEERKSIDDLHLITMKNIMYVCNIDEGSIGCENKDVKAVKEMAEAEDAEVITICGKLESEIASLDNEEERREFMESAGLEQSGLDRLVYSAYKMMGLRTFFTAGEKEVRAWTIKSGDNAPAAAGVIHSDFERGFIRAEVFSCEDLFQFGSEAKVKEGGRLRIEGKDYIVQDGDILHFRFNV